MSEVQDYPNPTEEMLNGDPLFDAIWKSIKGWDISRHNNGIYSGPSGNDARHIYDEILASGLPAAIEARDKALERVKALEAALENYFQAFDHGGTLLQTADKLCELRDVFRWGHP